MTTIRAWLSRPRAASVALIVATLAAATLLVSQNTQRNEVGPKPDGAFLLNTGWLLRPAGDQVPVDTLPMRASLSPNAKFLVVLNAGYKPPSISIIDWRTKKEVKRVVVQDSTETTPGAPGDAWYGLTFSPSGKQLYVGGGSRARVYEYDFDNDSGDLAPKRELLAVADIAKKGLTFIGDVAVSPDGHILYAADVHQDSILAFNLQSGTLIERWKTGKRPYRILVHPAGHYFLVSGWGDSSVYQQDANTGAVLSIVRVAAHPTDMLWLAKPAPTEEDRSPYAARLFVAAANTNSVYSFGVTSDGEFKPLEAINVALTPLQPLGMTPSALALSADQKRLYIACSDGNTVAAVDITEARSRVLGFIPTGWYPTGVVTLPGNQLAVLNGKGGGSHPNPNGPNPTKRPEVSHAGTPSTNQPVQYVGRIQTGTVSLLPEPGEEKLFEMTTTVRDDSPYRNDLQRDHIEGPQAELFIKGKDHPSPIRHVIYIIKENRTYDQVLGDIGKGNSEPSLTLFGENVTPNLHQLARDFILYDNFYENADVSADGHNWASAAIAPDYAVKMWPNSYAGRRKTYDYEGGEPANTPPAGYLWTNAMMAEVRIRNYGEWVGNVPLKEVKDGQHVGSFRDPSLKTVTDLKYRTFDLEYPDVDRAKEFIREWKEFEEKGGEPELFIARLGNDHTNGTAPGKLAPLSLNADNDQAVGMLVDAVSHSKFWGTTAIFIIEDDAQNGPDHVDSHRAPAFVISPYTRRGVVDSNFYNQASVLHTIEAVLGMRPMTQFDASAPVMFAGFSPKPDPRPWTSLPPKTSLTERNDPRTETAKESAKLDFSDADRVDDDQLNGILWRSLKKAPVPVPVSSIFGK